MSSRQASETAKAPAAVTVPEDVAYVLCEDIRREGRWYSYRFW